MINGCLKIKISSLFVIIAQLPLCWFFEAPTLKHRNDAKKILRPVKSSTRTFVLPSIWRPYTFVLVLGTVPDLTCPGHGDKSGLWLLPNDCGGLICRLYVFFQKPSCIMPNFWLSLFRISNKSHITKTSFVWIATVQRVISSNFMFLKCQIVDQCNVRISI
jgi:hypothetical protein